MFSAGNDNVGGVDELVQNELGKLTTVRHKKTLPPASSAPVKGTLKIEVGKILKTLKIEVVKTLKTLKVEVGKTLKTLKI